MKSSFLKLASAIIIFIVPAFYINCAPVIKAIGGEKADFGEYPAKEKKETIFKISNTGDEPLKIKNIRNTCTCARTELSKTEIKKDETAELKVIVGGDAIYGPYSKNIYVETNNPAQRFLVFNISGNARPLIKVSPENTVYTGSLEKNKKWKEQFSLECTEDGISLNEPITEGTTPLKASLTRVGNKKYILSCEIIPQTIGEFKAAIKISIIKPEGWKPVLISITGRTGSQLMIIPSKIALPVSTSGNIEKTFQFRLSGSKAVAPELITFTAIKGINIKFENENTVSVRISFTSEFIKSFKPGKNMKIKFQYPDTEGADLIVSTE